MDMLCRDGEGRLVHLEAVCSLVRRGRRVVLGVDWVLGGGLETRCYVAGNVACINTLKRLGFCPWHMSVLHIYLVNDMINLIQVRSTLHILARSPDCGGGYMPSRISNSIILSATGVVHTVDD
jgi:hypothetical protein